MRTRIVLGAAGILLGLFGVFRLLTQVSGSDLVGLLIWLIAAVVLHDFVLSPIVAAFGWGLGRVLPPRAGRFVAYALTAAVGVTVIALFEIDRRGTIIASKALLLRNYGLNLAIALGVIVAVALLGYALSVIRELRPRTNATNVRPSHDQDSSIE